MNKCAFCIPIHPKHFDYAHHIIDQLSGSDADLYLLFTSKEEKASFNNDGLYSSLFLEDFTDLDIIKENNSYITIKKFYGLSVLKDKYEYIACIDAEVKFLIKTGFYNIMKKVADSKVFFGSILEQDNTGRCIIYDTLYSITPSEDHENLTTISRNCSVYTWWSNIPVYSCAHLPDFLKWIDFRNDNLKNYNWNIFDHMLYNYFCVLFKGYGIKLSPYCLTSFEFLPSEVIEKIDAIEKLYWVNYIAYKQNPVFYEKNGFCLVYHCDRLTFPD